MRFFLIFLCLSTFGIAPAFADQCRDRFVELLTKKTDRGPVKIHAVQEIKGGMISKNYFYQIDDGHWMTEMIEPANLQWTLMHNNTLYSSSDKGNNWTKIREFDSQANLEDAQKGLERDAESARETECSMEEIDGVSHEKVKGIYDSSQGNGSLNTFIYWVNPESQWIRKAEYAIRASNFESKTIQMIDKAPDLELPRPE